MTSALNFRYQIRKSATFENNAEDRKRPLSALSLRVINTSEMRNGPPDFSSKEYWTSRFEEENEFEWLARSEVIVSLVIRLAEEVLSQRRTTTITSTGEREESSDQRSVRILNFGCGSSSLGVDLQNGLSEHFDSQVRVDRTTVQVVDADYVQPELLSARSIPVVQLDVLDIQSLDALKQEFGEWDILVDKSTADAISCGPNITTDNGDTKEPIEVLCDSLANATKKGTKWVSISYSTRRYDHLVQKVTDTSIVNADQVEIEKGQWSVLEKRPLGSVSMPEGKVIKDGKGWRTVYEPETPVWVYILERT